MTEFKNISVIGLGYIGLPTACLFASHGIHVTGVDVVESVIETLSRGEIHIAEPGLETLAQSVLADGMLAVTTTPKAAQAFLIAVPTPFKGDSHDPDLRYIKAAADSIAPVLTSGNLIILESTSPVGATEQLAAWLSAARPDLTFPATHGDASDIRIAYCPERIIPGKALEELVSNDRVIGGLTQRCSEQAIDLYKSFVKGACAITNARTAEMVKLTENSFRDVNIAFANELSMICDKLDINVWDLIPLANLHPRVNILQPGPGVGGHCIAVDPWFIVSRTPEEAALIRTARLVNNKKPEWVIEKIEKAIQAQLDTPPQKSEQEITLAFYGLAFKPDVDDLRESPALNIAYDLASRHRGNILIVEPNIKNPPAILAAFENLKMVSPEEAMAAADVHVLLVGHREFREMGQPNTGITIDAVGVWDTNK